MSSAMCASCPYLSPAENLASMSRKASSLRARRASSSAVMFGRRLSSSAYGSHEVTGAEPHLAEDVDQVGELSLREPELREHLRVQRGGGALGEPAPARGD